MPKKTCETCSEEFQGKPDQRFCCRGCYDAWLRKVREERRQQKEAAWLSEQREDSCVYNVGVCCLPEGDCKRCGWNPEVAGKRLNRILAALLGVEEVVSNGD